MSNESFYAGAVKIFRDGVELGPDIMSNIYSVIVEDEINLPTMFSIAIGMQDIEQGEWRGIDMNSFSPGDEIKIEMGLNETQSIVTGEIVSIEPHFDNPAILELHGFDFMHRMRFGTYRRSFQQIKDSDLASQFAQDAGMSAEVDDTDTIHPYLFQNNISNYDFLLTRANQIDYELIVEDNRLMFKRSGVDGEPVTSLAYGIDLVKFSAKLTALPKGGEIEVRGWDVAKKEEITATARSGSERTLMGGAKSGYAWSESFGPSNDAIIDQIIIDVQDAEKKAKASYNRQLMNFIKGKGETIGNPLLRRGKTVEFTGLGDKFSGIYYIVGSKHVYRFDEGYTTVFSVRRTGI